MANYLNLRCSNTAVSDKFKQHSIKEYRTNLVISILNLYYRIASRKPNAVLFETFPNCCKLVLLLIKNLICQVVKKVNQSGMVEVFEQFKVIQNKTAINCKGSESKNLLEEENKIKRKRGKKE